MADQQLNNMQQYYSEARTAQDAVSKILSRVENNLKIAPPQIVYADSFCCDELCSMQFPQNEMNGSFKLGGLGGYPFSGLTGMKAFAGHIPDEGAALIFYGPHVGITEEGTIGKVKRIGQEHTTNCCGSASAALYKLLQNQIKKDDTDEEDYQQKMIEQILLKEEKRIKASNRQIVEAAEVIYEAIDHQIEQLISETEFNCSYLIKAGGIFINSDGDMEAFWAPRRFEIVDVEKG